eukprot:scaffold93660_cov49-Prasinocladus_malaysianus.AAC.2
MQHFTSELLTYCPWRERLGALQWIMKCHSPSLIRIIDSNTVTNVNRERGSCRTAAIKSKVKINKDPHGCRTGELERVAFKDEVDVVGKLYALATGQRQQAVVVEDAVERLDPLRVHVAVADDPRMLLQWLLNHLSTENTR